MNELLQLYVKTTDVIPTEQKEVEPAKETVDPDEMGKWSYLAWLDDFKENGIKHQLRIHPTGHIGDGNFRYWGGGRHLKMEYLPIDITFFLGIQNIGGEFITVRQNVLPFLDNPFSKKPVARSVDTFPEQDGRCEYSKLGQGSHPYVKMTPFNIYKKIVKV